MSFSELLRDDVGPDLNEDATRDLEFIEDSAKRMSTLVRDLLVLSKSGRTELRAETIDLDDCLERVLESLSVSIDESDATVTNDPLGSVRGDAVLLTQLLQNLVANALRFRATGREPTVHISRETRDGAPVFAVEDNGIGIEPQYTEMIFTPFKRLHGRSEYPGTGIGLAICRKAVERHNGKIWVESTPGEGSRFLFSLGELPDDDAGVPAADTESTLH